MEKKITLNEIGLKYNADKSSRYHNFLDFYEKHLPKRDFKGRILEIGVMDGASLNMWREYYPNAKEIVGIDIRKPKKITGCKVLRLDATDINRLSRLGMFDIIIDDGSHLTSHQQISFNHLYYNSLNIGGVYVMEDLHTSFMESYIDTKQTTYDFIKEHFPKALEYARLGDDKTDSVTMILKND